MARGKRFRIPSKENVKDFHVRRALDQISGDLLSDPRLSGRFDYVVSKFNAKGIYEVKHGLKGIPTDYYITSFRALSAGETEGSSVEPDEISEEQPYVIADRMTRETFSISVPVACEVRVYVGIIDEADAVESRAEVAEDDLVIPEGVTPEDRVVIDEVLTNTDDVHEALRFMDGCEILSADADKRALGGFLKISGDTWGDVSNLLKRCFSFLTTANVPQTGVRSRQVTSWDSFYFSRNSFGGLSLRGRLRGTSDWEVIRTFVTSQAGGVLYGHLGLMYSVGNGNIHGVIAESLPNDEWRLWKWNIYDYVLIDRQFVVKGLSAYLRQKNGPFLWTDSRKYDILKDGKLRVLGPSESVPERDYFHTGRKTYLWGDFEVELLVDAGRLRVSHAGVIFRHTAEIDSKYWVTFTEDLIGIRTDKNFDDRGGWTFYDKDGNVATTPDVSGLLGIKDSDHDFTGLENRVRIIGGFMSNF